MHKGGLWYFNRKLVEHDLNFSNSLVLSLSGNVQGTLNGINSRSYANDLNLTQSQGHEYCELKTWLK
jgi:hypothetical protein